MDPRTTILVGGGGGASVVVPHLAEELGLKNKNAKNAPVISTIGVALAMIRDMVERTIPNPTDQDVLAVRCEAVERAIAAGANPDTVEVSVEVDTSKNLVRAIAIGTTELRTKDLGSQRLDEDELKKKAAENMDVAQELVYTAAQNGMMYAMQARNERKKFFGLSKTVTTPTRLIDSEGVIRLQKNNGHVRQTIVENWKPVLKEMAEEYTVFDDGGENLPNVYVVLGKKIIDLCNLADLEQVLALASVELGRAKPQEQLIIICSDKKD